jgi:hypothetical protein
MKESNALMDQFWANVTKAVENHSSLRDDILKGHEIWCAVVMKVAGISPGWKKFMDSIPPEQWPKHVDGGEEMKKWENEAYEHSKTINFARKMEPYLQSEELESFFIEELGNHAKGKNVTMMLRDINARFVRESAVAIGSIVAKQITKGNNNALNTIGDGLNNLAKGRAFKPKAGRAKSSRQIEVLFAFHDLKRQGIEKPSQVEVKKHLAAQGDPIGKEMLSRIFDELGLKEEASDAREAKSQAGERKRKRT